MSIALLQKLTNLERLYTAGEAWRIYEDEGRRVAGFVMHGFCANPITTRLPLVACPDNYEIWQRADGGPRTIFYEDLGVHRNKDNSQDWEAALVFPARTAIWLEGRSVSGNIGLSATFEVAFRRLEP